MLVRRLCSVAILLSLGLTSVSVAQSQDGKTRRGRKYKAPAETSHVEVQILRDNNGKPITNAAVIFHPVKDGKDEGNLEVKTNEEGKAIIDVIPTGSTVGVQVIADGFATYAGDYLVNESSRDIVVRMLKPQAQISTYQDMHGKESQRSDGVQEPRIPTSAPVVDAPKPTNHTSDPNPTTPVSPNATPGNSQNRTPQ